MNNGKENPLCITCIIEAQEECWLIKEVNLIISNPDTPAWKKHQLISVLRENAMTRYCNSTNYDPIYVGREKL